MIMAIFMLLLLSGAAVLTLKYSRIQGRHFVDSYNKEQAELFLHSVLEASVMKLQGFDRKANNSCLNRFNFISLDGRFEANVSVERYYLFEGKDNDGTPMPSNCVVKAIKSPQSHGFVLLNIIVQSTKHAKIITPIRIVKRSLQRL